MQKVFGKKPQNGSAFSILLFIRARIKYYSRATSSPVSSHISEKSFSEMGMCGLVPPDAVPEAEGADSNRNDAAMLLVPSSVIRANKNVNKM